MKEAIDKVASKEVQKETTKEVNIRKSGRERLLEAGLNLFSIKGYHGTSVREISEAAEINVSQISFYFGGKQGLLNVLFEDVIKVGLNNLHEELGEFEGREAFKQGLLTFFSKFVDSYLNNDKLFRLFWDELEKGNEAALEIFPKSFGGLHDLLEDYLTRGQAQGYIKQELDPKILAIEMSSPFLVLMAFAKSGESYPTLVSFKDAGVKEKLIDQLVKRAV